jgi:hypothetical protein
MGRKNILHTSNVKKEKKRKKTNKERDEKRQSNMMESRRGHLQARRTHFAPLVV